MVTSRTGTASHKRFRRAVLNRDRRAGVTHCPLCSVLLDYTTGLLPNSAEPDHIIPWESGGPDHVDNGRTICRLCNERRGKKPIASTAPPRTRTVTTLIQW